MEKRDVLIIGYGVVGKNISKELDAANIAFAVYDVTMGLERLAALKTISFRYAFVCVPTNKQDDGSCDSSVVMEVLQVWDDNVGTFIIKSTVPPGTSRRFEQHLNHANVAFSPEYYGGTQHANTPHPFQIVGGVSVTANREVCELYKRMLTGYARLFVVDTETAELVKYAENTWLAMQVTFFNQFARICEELFIDNESFREALLLDERISRSHSFVYRDKAHYDSHCLNKDVPAIVAFCQENEIEAGFIQAIIDANEYHKENPL